MEIDIVPFQARLERLCYSYDIRLVGFANIENNNIEIFKKYSRAMVIANPFDDELMNYFEDDIFKFHVKHIKSFLETIALRIFNILTMEGYKALILPSLFLKSDNEYSEFNKVTAKKAGLGNIGKGDFFVSPTFGNKIVICSVLTDAPFEYDGENNLDLCKVCNICEKENHISSIKKCPYGKNKNFINRR